MKDVRQWFGDILYQPIIALSWVVNILHRHRRCMWLYNPKNAPLRILRRILVEIWLPFYVPAPEDESNNNTKDL